MKNALLAFVAVLGTAAGARALVQPTSIPGSYDLTTQPLPDLDSAIAWLADEERPVYGIYTWGYEFRTNVSRINEVGWTSIRMGGDLDDVAMLFVAQNPHLEVMHTIMSTRRDDCASDAEFLSTYMSAIKEKVAKYGPDGSFFTSRPTLPYNPVMHWEIWNEPNFHYMWADGSNTQREALYARVLPMAYDTVKHYAPTAQVGGFCTGGSGAGDLRFYSNVMSNNGAVASSFDFASTHPYVTPVPTETYKRESWGGYSIANSLQSLRSRMVTGGRKHAPMWYTEIGWEISQADGGTYERSSDKTVSPLLQAAYITRLYAYAMRLGVARVHPMFIVDSDGFNGGFFRGSTWRQQAYAAKEMIAQLPDPLLVNAVSDGVNGYYAYAFDPDKTTGGDDPVIMAWNVEGPVTRNLPVESGEDYVLVDMLGDSTSFTASGSTYPVEVGPCPVYLRKGGMTGAVGDVRIDRIAPVHVPSIMHVGSNELQRITAQGGRFFDAVGRPANMSVPVAGTHFVYTDDGEIRKTVVLP